LKAFKVFDPDWTCRGFLYEVGKIYEEDVNPSLCDRGFHFCKKLADCFNYYNFDPNNKVAKIEAIGDICEGGDKCCTNKIKIIEEISWEEVLEMVNIGKGNTGLGNSGSGNSGHRNSGSGNSGHRNSGDRNSGRWNSGSGNTGDWNSGNWNSGGRNSGDWNSGHLNSGSGNSGDWNSGSRNSGDRNSGDRNSGDWNSGDFNLTDNNSGCFNVDDHKLLFFDRETEMTWHQWRNSRACKLLWDVDSRPTEWICADDMTDQEKEKYPTYETTGGYLKVRDISKAYQEWWKDLNDDQKQCIREIPNFDAKKFEMITGIPEAEL
jgi:hypothetical protein